MTPQEKRELIHIFVEKVVYGGKSLGAIMEVRQVK